jgi:hypothetical protein
LLQLAKAQCLKHDICYILDILQIILSTYMEETPISKFLYMAQCVKRVPCQNTAVCALAPDRDPLPPRYGVQLQLN